MRFHSVAVLCALAAPSVDAFGVSRPQVSFAGLSKSVLKAKDPYDFGDDLFAEPKEKTGFFVDKTPKEKKGRIADQKPSPAPVPAPAPVPEPEPVVKAKKQKVKKSKKVEPVVEVKAPEPEPAPVVEEPKLKKGKNKKAAKVETPKAPEPPKAAPKKETKKAEPKAVSKDANAVPAGVALGGAPLLLAPIIALSAARSTLSSTKARRDEIAEEIEVFEAAEAKRLAKKNTDVDGATLGKAVVSI